MTKKELNELGKGRTLYIVSRKISRSGMREVFDVFYFNRGYNMMAQEKVDTYPRWIKIQPEESKEFHKRAECHASLTIDQDNKIGGTFYVNGCGFNRAAAVIESLGIFAANDPQFFQFERI